MIKFNVKTCLGAHLHFTAEIPCAEDAPAAEKLGLAVRWAHLNGVRLAGADLTGADLRDPILPTANLWRAVGLGTFGAQLER